MTFDEWKAKNAKECNPFTPPDYSPTLDPYKNPKPFLFWCQKVLPLVYTEALSYVEVLYKTQWYINNILSDLKTMADNIDKLHDAYDQLEQWVTEEMKRFECDLLQQWEDWKTATKSWLEQLFEDYKAETDEWLQQKFEEYKNTTNTWLEQKFNEYAESTNQKIEQWFNEYKDEANQTFNEWKQNFQQEFNEWKSSVNSSISNMQTQIDNINEQIENIKQTITQNFPKFELKSIVGTGTKYYQRCYIDFLSFPSDSDSKILCYGILRTIGQAESVTVSGNWAERFAFTPADITDIKTRLGWSGENCLKLELMPRCGYVSESGNAANGAPIRDTMVQALLWIDAEAGSAGRLYCRNNGAVGFVSDTSYLFSAILTDQTNPPDWSAPSGEWTN